MNTSKNNNYAKESMLTSRLLRRYPMPPWPPPPLSSLALRGTHTTLGRENRLIKDASINRNTIIARHFVRHSRSYAKHTLIMLRQREKWDRNHEIRSRRYTYAARNANGTRYKMARGFVNRAANFTRQKCSRGDATPSTQTARTFRL